MVEKGELSDQDQNVTVTDLDQTLSEEQTYRENMRAIRSYMGWSHIPDVDTATSTSDDKPFAGPNLQLAGKVSVKMPTDEWLCKKLTMVEGYPSRSSEAGWASQRPVHLTSEVTKWYELHTNQTNIDSDSVSSFNTDASKLNSSYSQIARMSSIA